ncbi:hypothetical protein MASR2M8_02210 [Opitutaceae bacterium]
MNTVLRPAGLIIGNDLRLSFREHVAEKWRSGFSLILVIGLLAFMHVASVGFFVSAKDLPSMTIQTSAWILVSILMMVAGLNHAMRVVSHPADLDLLLSSPVPRTAVLIARILGTSAAALMASALVALPALNAALLVHGPRLAWGYLVWLLLAIAIAGATNGVTSLTVQRSGSVRPLARIQTGAAILLTAIGLTIQSRTLLPSDWVITASDLAQWARKIPGSLLPAQASQGDPGSLLALVAAALACTAFAVLRLPGALTTGLRASVASPPQLSAGSRLVFSTGSTVAAIRKDFRLFARDAALFSKVLPVALFALPGFFLAGQALHATPPTILAAYGTFAVVVVSTQLGKLSAQQEACWDLISQSPTSVVVFQKAKVAACLIPALAIGALAAGTTAGLGRPGLAIISQATGLLCGIGATWMELCEARPPSRAGVMARNVNPDAVTPGRLIAAFAFVLSGPLGVGLIAFGLLRPGLGLLVVSLAAVIVTCGLTRPRGTRP